MPKWIYDFTEGSRDMRELPGGKGANVAERTRVLGADRVPAGFTITPEARVAYMRPGQTEPDGMTGQVADALARIEGRAGKRLGDPGGRSPIDSHDRPPSRPPPCPTAASEPHQRPVSRHASATRGAFPHTRAAAPCDPRADRGPQLRVK
jgi:hypothetical protein